MANVANATTAKKEDTLWSAKEYLARREEANKTK